MRALIYAACVASLLPWLRPEPVTAQEAIAAGIAENIASGRSATDFNSRVRIRSGYFELPRDTSLVLTRLSGTYAPHPSVALHVQLPLLHADPDVSSGKFGTTDLSARVLCRAWNRRRAAAFVGMELFFPTASDPLLGAEKYSIAPLVVGFFQLSENVSFIPIYQQIISYAGNSDRADLNILRIRPVLVAQWPQRWWTALDPGFLWDLENDLPTKDTLTLGLEVGKRMVKPFTVSGKPSIQVYGSEDFAWAFELSFSYRFD